MLPCTASHAFIWVEWQIPAMEVTIDGECYVNLSVHCAITKVNQGRQTDSDSEEKHNSGNAKELNMGRKFFIVP